MATAFPQSPWVIRHQRVGGDELWGITSGPNGLVAVGTNGAILQSTDGSTWTRRSSGTTDWLTAVTYGKDRYLAVGDHGHILSSFDGATWVTVAQSATTQRLNNVLYGYSFTAVGDAGAIVMSDDGSTWTAVQSGTTKWLRGLARGYVGGAACVVATGQAGTVLVYSGGVWKAITGGVTSDLEAIAFNVAVEGYGITNTGSGVITFAAAGTPGSIVACNCFFNVPYEPYPGGGLVAIESKSMALISSSRVRCVICGPRRAASFDGNAGYLQSLAGFASPMLAVDEAGNIFSAEDFQPDWTQIPVGFPSSWRRDPFTLSTAVKAGIYFGPQESFYVVGSGETIYQRDQVFNGRLGNISTRSLVGQGDKALLAGFVVKGSTAKSVLVRAIGPALRNLGVNGALGSPVLSVLDSAGTVIATNEGWSSNNDPTAVALASSRCGAFPLPVGSDDDALVLTLSPGSYTARVTTASASSGVGLVEIYDLDERVSGTSRAINLSTRGQVATGENALIAGLSVQGPDIRTFLIRAVGASLAKFGVANALPDPVLDVSSNVNTNGRTGFRLNRNGADVAAATTAAGAFPLDYFGQKDDALVATLPPGSYTFRASSKSGATGIGLIEVYELPVSQ